MPSETISQSKEASLSMIVYKAVNTVNGKVYVGITKRSLRERIKAHKHCSQHDKTTTIPFASAIRKYGIDSFKFSEIDTADCRESLHGKEIMWIKALNCRVPHGYNVTAGGDGSLGVPHTPEFKEKIRRLMTGRVVSEETRQRASLSHKGKPGHMKGKRHSPECIEKIRLAKLGTKATAETRAKLSAVHLGKKRIATSQTLRCNRFRRGKPMSEETRQHMSKMNSGEGNPNFGRKHTEESRRKISDAASGRPCKLELKAHFSKLYTGSGNPNFGRVASIEKRVKMSIAMEASIARRKALGLHIGRPPRSKTSAA